MTEMLLPALAGLLLILDGLSALTSHSLRDFSRSRLDEICRRKGREARFSAILHRHEEALIVAELLTAVFTVGLAAVVLGGWGMWGPGEPGVLGWAAYLTELLALGLILLLAVVVLPWTAARVVGERFLYHAWPVLELLTAAFKPVIALVRVVDTLGHRLSGIPEPENGEAAAITDEIRSVVDEGQREGILESEARTMIHRVIELQQEDAGAIMTPRTDMVCIPADSTLEEARQRLLEAGHSRVPVIGESTDDVMGILYSKDLLKYLDNGNGQQFALRDILREPLYVPETTGIDTLLETMKREHIHFAIVVDEYGGVAGLVTLEDILEEIVGEIVDEYDVAEEQPVVAVGPQVIEVESRVHIDDLNEQFDYGLPEDGDFETIGGFVVSELGRIPKPRDAVTWNNLRITVLEADKRRVHKLRIEQDESLATPAAGTS